MQPPSRLMHSRRLFASWRSRQIIGPPMFRSIDGIHGKNLHPGHLIAVFDLVARRHAGDFSTYPYLAPHGLRWGPQGQLYCVCESSGVVLEMDAPKGSIEDVIEVGSDKASTSSLIRARPAVSDSTSYLRSDPLLGVLRCKIGGRDAVTAKFFCGRRPAPSPASATRKPRPLSSLVAQTWRTNLRRPDN